MLLAAPLAPTADVPAAGGNRANDMCFAARFETASPTPRKPKSEGVGTEHSSMRQHAFSPSCRAARLSNSCTSPRSSGRSRENDCYLVLAGPLRVALLLAQAVTSVPTVMKTAVNVKLLLRRALPRPAPCAPRYRASRPAGRVRPAALVMPGVPLLRAQRFNGFAGVASSRPAKKSAIRRSRRAVSCAISRRPMMHLALAAARGKILTRFPLPILIHAPLSARASLRGRRIHSAWRKAACPQRSLRRAS